jgi:hypothetical protein
MYKITLLCLPSLTRREPLIDEGSHSIGTVVQRVIPSFHHGYDEKAEDGREALHGGPALSEDVAVPR